MHMATIVNVFRAGDLSHPAARATHATMTNALGHTAGGLHPRDGHYSLGALNAHAGHRMLPSATKSSVTTITRDQEWSHAPYLTLHRRKVIVPAPAGKSPPKAAKASR